VVPDILLLAKPLGGGLPISALVTTAAVAGVMQVGDHGSTFGGNPVAAAAGVVLMQQLAKPGFLKQVQTKAALLEEQLRGLAQKHPGLVVDIRGLGLMWGMEVKDHGPAIVQKALEAGLVINCTAGQVLRFLPSLIVSEAQIEKMIKILDKVLKHFK
jgi:acetylornithine/succinyldiaminopimelate/putrescine aminotransferase